MTEHYFNIGDLVSLSLKYGEQEIKYFGVISSFIDETIDNHLFFHCDTFVDITWLNNETPYKMRYTISYVNSHMKIFKPT